jgi:hypothetical protein
MLNTLIALVLVFTFGFVCGRYTGKRNGYRIGLAEAPLLMRQKSWESKACVLCKAQFHQIEGDVASAPQQSEC